MFGKPSPIRLKCDSGILKRCRISNRKSVLKLNSTCAVKIVIFCTAGKSPKSSHKKKIAYHWRYDGYAGDSIVTWELAGADDDEGGTQLKFTHAILKPFPQDDPIFSREACQGGWNYFLNERLKPFLEDR